MLIRFFFSTNIDGPKQALSELSDKVEQVDNKKLNINGGTSMNVDLDMGNNKLVNLATPTQNSDGATKGYVGTEIANSSGGNALLPDGSSEMAADLNMNNNKIINLSTDSHNVLSATNIRYVNQVNGAMITTLTDSFTKKINESHISGSTNRKSVFQYLMDDVNQSASKSNIIVN